MTVIQGPIQFKDVGEFITKYADKVPIKLPFEAKGWKSDKMPQGNLIGINDSVPKPITPPVEEKPKPIEEIQPKHKSFKQELIDLPKIGAKKAEHIMTLATTKEGLGKIPRKTLVTELGEEIAKILDDYLGRVG